MKIDAPAGLSYLPFQEEGIRFAASRPAALIGDEMGLGKTVQGIGLMNTIRPDRVLVVPPAGLVLNWQDEIDKWLVDPCVQVDIVNYEMLGKFDLSTIYDLCILDEGHYIQNDTAWRSRYCRMIKARRRVILTGTPILNRPINIWHLLHWLHREKFPLSSYDKFGQKFCGAYRRMISKTRSKWIYKGSSNEDELARLLQPLMIRRLKADVLTQLPKKLPPQIIRLPAGGITPELQAQFLEASRDMDRTEEQFKNDVAALEEARQVAWSRQAIVRHAAGLATVPMALPLIGDAIDSMGKVVVFAYHLDVIQALAEGLKPFSPVVVTGEQTTRARHAAVKAFQDRSSACKVFLGQIDAAGVGLTLTAAHHVMFVEFDHTPGKMDQDTDRVHRITQTEQVTVQYLVLDGSPDARMIKAQVRKRETIARCLGDPKA